MWNVFGQPGSLGQDGSDHEKAESEKLPYEVNKFFFKLGSLFLQKTARKTCEIFSIYADNPDLIAGETFDPHTMRQALKLSRETKFPRHKCPHM